MLVVVVAMVIALAVQVVLAVLTVLVAQAIIVLDVHVAQAAIYVLIAKLVIHNAIQTISDFFHMYTHHQLDSCHRQ